MREIIYLFLCWEKKQSLKAYGEQAAVRKLPNMEDQTNWQAQDGVRPFACLNSEVSPYRLDGFRLQVLWKKRLVSRLLMIQFMGTVQTRVYIFKAWHRLGLDFV